MLNKNLWKAKFEEELQNAETARSAGNEGKARVCARRAAGIAAGEYFRRQKLSFSNPSAYDRLRFLRTLTSVSTAAIDITEHLLLRITPEHNLPVDADLITETRQLAVELLGDKL